jgi:thermopsin
MAARRVWLVGIALVTVLMALSSLGLSAVPVGHTAAGPSAAGATAAHASLTSVGSSGLRTLPSAPDAIPATNPTGGVVRENPLAARGLAAARAAGIPASEVFVPAAGATPGAISLARTTGHVSPGYPYFSPAPLGLAYYGLSANTNGNGSVVASTLNAQSLLATVDTNATGIVPAYPFDSSPDEYGIQLNAVSTSVNLFGNDTYQFWSQNVFEYSPLQHVAYLVTNIWNFSAGGAGIPDNTIVSHGPDGSVQGNTVYIAEKIISGVTYPFDLSLWMNNSLVGGQNEISFTVGITTGGVTTIYPYDWAVFNSTSAAMSDYTANGVSYNKIGLTNDFELMVGGPGGGSQVDLFAADANLTLQYWNSTKSAFEAVPAAYSAGSETGETSTGAYVGWEKNATTGQPYGIMRSGPGILRGLWNETGTSGLTKVTLSVTPSNAFFFFAPNETSNFSYEGSPYWAPQELTGGVFWLAPGDYNLSILLADYDEAIGALVVGSTPISVVYSMVANAANGIYTPLYAWENSQFPAISNGGAGVPSDPYQIVNAQPFAMASIFGTFNDYTFPVYSGVMFWGTSASVVMSNMPAMATQMPYINVATSSPFPNNDLQYLLYNCSNVALVNSTHIGGWFFPQVFYGYESGEGAPFVGNFYQTFSVDLWNVTDALIANDTFRTQAAGLALAGGHSNVVWGNTFTMAPQPTGLPEAPLNLSLGIEEAEQVDLIYNNAFDTTDTAVNAPFDLYTSAVVQWQNIWNITPTPAATVNHAAGFPEFPLTGTIIGNATQGGNYWWDYGSAANPKGVLPYDEYNTTLAEAQIYNGGDYYPLIPPPPMKYAVSFSETGLPAGLTWSVTFNGTAASVLTASGTNTLNFASAVNGPYGYSITDISGWHQNTIPYAGAETVSGAPLAVSMTYTNVTYPVTFDESNLASGTTWSVTIGSTTLMSATSSIVFQEWNGTWSYTANPVAGYVIGAPTGSLKVSGGPQGTTIVFTPAPTTYSVTFTESGLASGTSWSVTFDSSTQSSAGTSITFSGVATGLQYSFSVGSVSGYTSSASVSSPLTVSGANVAVQVTFTSTGSPPSSGGGGFGGLSTLEWIVIAVVIIAVIAGVAVALTRRGRGGAASPASEQGGQPQDWDQAQQPPAGGSGGN